MVLTDTELDEFKYDPGRMQSRIIDFLSEATEDGIVINDPTNPFIMLLESTVTGSANALKEMLVHTRKIYPVLANDDMDIYHHISDKEYVDMFASPCTAAIAFFVNLKDLRNGGYRAVGTSYVKTTIPKETTVTVSDTIFTLLNDVHVYYYDNGKVFVEQDLDDSEISVTNLGVLDSVITSDQNGIEWVLFETLVRQVKKTNIEDTIIVARGYSKTITLTDQYYYADVSIRNQSTGNEWMALNKTHSDIVFNPNIPTVDIRYIDNKITFSIPKVYLINGSVSGNIKIEIYTTKGAISLPINSFEPDEFKISLGDIGRTSATATSSDLAILCNSRVVADGGRDKKSFEELRESVINNTTGQIDLPITEHTLKEAGSINGFDLYKALDVVTERIFVASKNTVPATDSVVKARIDLFVSTVKNILGELEANDFVTLTDNEIIIKSNTVFKEENGIVSIVSNTEHTALLNMTAVELMSAIKDNRYFFTPYYYIIDKLDKVINSRVYNLDTPVINTLHIVSKNTSSNVKANITQYRIDKTDTGYVVTVALIGNSEFDSISPAFLRAQMAIPISNSTEKVYIDAVVDPATKNLSFTLDTSFYINEDDGLVLTNGGSVLVNKIVELTTTATIITYIVDPNIVLTSYSATYDLYLEDSDYAQALTTEQLSLTFGTTLKFLWNKVTTGYTERMYLKYDYDVPAVYTEDVYEIDPITNSIFTAVDTNGDGLCDTLDYNILHAKGDPLLDENGDPVYLHRIGDLVLDENMSPTVDVISGVVRYIDILTIGYEFKRATSLNYKDYLTTTLDTVHSWLTGDLTELNKRTLEQTTIFYKPYKAAKDVTVVMNDLTLKIPYLTTPVITLYRNISTDYTNDELVEVRNTIGGILHTNLEKIEISLSSIKEEIIKTIGNGVVGVKIENIDNNDGMEAFVISDNSNRLTVNKVLNFDKDGTLIVDYDIDLKIAKI